MGIQSSINQTLATAGVAATAIKHVANEKDKSGEQLRQLEQEDRLQKEIVDVDRSTLKLHNEELQNKWSYRDLSSQMRQEKNLYKTGKMDEETYIKSRQEAIRQQTLLKKQRLDFELQRQELSRRQSNLQKRLDFLKLM